MNWKKIAKYTGISLGALLAILLILPFAFKGKIVSAVKSGSTTATITTATPHGLTVNDYIIVIGIRDQTNFANQASQVVVASVINSTQFTVSFGASATATSYGGFVARVQGANIPANLTSPAVQTAQVSTTSFGNVLILVAATNWSWPVGDYVNVYGVRDNVSGADLGVDGTYKVGDVFNTTLTLLPIGTTTLPTTFAATNAGGTAIRRTDVRLSYARIFQYVRERVELLNRSDAFSSVPVVLNGGFVSSGNITPINLNTYSLLTSTNLASSATYTGSSTNAAATTTSSTVYFTAVAVAVQHTAGFGPGTLFFEVGSETTSTAPTTWYPQFVVPIPSNASWQNFTFPLTTRYYRVRFVNGSVAQTSFRLATMQIYNGALGGDLTYPDRLLIPLSTNTLAANAAFTSGTLDFGESNRLYKSMTATVFADQASATNGFQIQVSRDGSTWRTITQATVTASTLTVITADLVYRYARVVYTNGATLQGAFNLDCQASV